MLESNTEAKQATGTGSKRGQGAGKGVRGQPSGLSQGSGVLPSPRGRDSPPRKIGTRVPG